MLNAWWIHGGRLLASANPTDSDLGDLRAKGFAVLVSLIDERHEWPNYYVAGVAGALAKGWTRYKIAIPRSGTPSVEQLQEFVRLIQTVPPEGKILVHCGTGSGRAAVMGAAYWIDRGLPVEAAIGGIRAVKGEEWITEDRRAVLNEFGRALQQCGPHGF